MNNTRGTAFEAVLTEMESQDEKWGKDRNLEPILWSAILTEECGEFAQAALHDKFGGDKAEGLRMEAVQVAAVALQIIENIDRNNHIKHGNFAKPPNEFMNIPYIKSYVNEI